jgi:hypothetical protein
MMRSVSLVSKAYRGVAVVRAFVDDTLALFCRDPSVRAVLAQCQGINRVVVVQCLCSFSVKPMQYQVYISAVVTVSVQFRLRDNTIYACILCGDSRVSAQCHNRGSMV